MTDSGTGHRTFDLAAEADFPLGGMVVRPRLCAVAVAGFDQRIEPRVMQVLVVLARAGGQTVSRDRLIETCWSARAVTDDAVHRVIAKVRQVGRLTTPPSFEIRTLPKVGFLLLASGPATGDGDETPLVPSAPTPVQSTSEGDKRQKATWDIPVRIRRVGNAPAAAAAALAALAALGFWIAAGVGDPPRADASGVIVELGRVRALTADAEVVTAADRLEDALVGQFQGMAALASASGSDDAVFHLDALTDRERGGFVFTARILGKADGIVHWSTPRRAGVAAHAFASEVAAITRCVVEQGAADVKSMSALAKSILFRVCEAVVVYRGDGVESARDLVAAAPDLSVGHAFLAYTLLDALESRRAGAAGDDAEFIAEATAAAERALVLNAENVVAHVALSRLARARRDFIATEAHLRDAAAADPDAIPYIMRQVSFLREVGRLDEALEGVRRAARLRGPRLAGWAPTLAFMQAMAGDLIAADEAIAAYGEIWPEERAGLAYTVAAWWRPPSEAAAIITSLPEASIAVVGRNCLLDALDALHPEAKAAQLPDSCAGLGLQWRVRLLSRLGDIDSAFAALGEADARDLNPLFFLFYPETAGLRRDPRFLTFAAQLGLFDYWRISGRWPDFCRDPELPYRCGAAVSATSDAAITHARANSSPLLASPPSSGGAREKIAKEMRLRVAFFVPGDGCDAGSREFFTKLGGIVGDGGVYDLSVDALPDGRFRWRAEGPRQSDCSEHEAIYISSLDPTAGGFTLWGVDFAFDDDGWVYDNWDNVSAHDIGAGAPVFSPARIVGRIIRE